LPNHIQCDGNPSKIECRLFTRVIRSSRFVEQFVLKASQPGFEIRGSPILN
jgi:hypothetical protein